MTVDAEWNAEHRKEKEIARGPRRVMACRCSDDTEAVLSLTFVCRALLDGPAWREWLPLDSVEWTGGKPFGGGATRTVCIGNDVIDEVFFAWEDQR